ncbi:MAG: competence/damage-inducible protein A [Clostridia bacterium]|nr:competence/damage-inducible protein A [Clostridia bacterium]
MEQIRSAEILCVGTELLLGDIVNTNAALMAERLAAFGIPVYRQTVVGDNPARLRTALEEAYSRADTVFLSGGLGPTCDDLTKETVAEYFGLPLYLDEESLERIKKYFSDIGRRMPDNNIKQAMIPEGAMIFRNDWGTAPAICIEKDRKTAILLPGPPVEIEQIWFNRVEPYLHLRSGSVIRSKNVHILNMGESAVEEVLRDMMLAGGDLTVAPYAKDGEVRVRVSARAADENTADALCDKAIEKIRETEVGSFIYGIDVGSAENALLIKLRAAGETLAVAESCTGGLLAKRITDIAGCSDVFAGGCVTYSNEAKMRLLGVKHDTLDKHTAVSAETAAEMARGVRLALGTSMGLATTGYAGPGGGTPEDPVGTVYVAVSTAEGERVKRLSMSPLRSRAYIRYSAATQALGLGLGLK